MKRGLTGNTLMDILLWTVFVGLGIWAVTLVVRRFIA